MGTRSFVQTPALVAGSLLGNFPLYLINNQFLVRAWSSQGCGTRQSFTLDVENRAVTIQYLRKKGARFLILASD